MPAHQALSAAEPFGTVAPRYLERRRLIDILLCSLLGGVSVPFVVLAAILMSILFRGSPWFYQSRIGKDGKPFVVRKLRTLRDAVDRDGRVLSDAERANWAGSILRRTRLDEVPQFLNVFRGEMALIGPRPLLHEDQPRSTGVRLSVLPGITGWAQVNGGGLVNADEKAALDAHYIRNAGPGLDFNILFRTVLTIFVGDRRGRLRRHERPSLFRGAMLEA